MGERDLPKFEFKCISDRYPIMQHFPVFDINTMESLLSSDAKMYFACHYVIVMNITSFHIKNHKGKILICVKVVKIFITK